MRPKAWKKVRRGQLAEARDTKRAKKDDEPARDTQESSVPGPSGDCDSEKADFPVQSASRKKIEVMREARDAPDGMEQVWCIAHTKQVSRLIQNLLCPECLKDGLGVRILPNANQGFAS